MIIFQISEGSLPPIKVILIGDTGVGKTSIIERFIHNQFDKLSSPSQGATFFSKDHTYGASKKVRYQIWDTAGQQKYKSIAQVYYRDSQVALLVYDITHKHSFQVLKNWMDELRQKGPQNLVLAVVGNKIDRPDQQQVSYEEAKEYAQKVRALFKLTSAKQGKGINQLFTSIAERLDQVKARNLVNSRMSVPLQKMKPIDKKRGGCCHGKQK